jgi:hypothetical protein
MVVGRRCGSALVKGWRRSSSEELRQDNGELLDRRWRWGGAGWTRCREGALYNGVCVRATRSNAAASAWHSSGAGIGRTWQQRGTGRLGARTQSAGRSTQWRRQELSEGVSQRGRLDALGVMRCSEEGRWLLRASKGSSEQWPSGTRHRCV